MIPLEKLTDGTVSQRNFEKIGLRAADTQGDVYKVGLPFAANWADRAGGFESASYSRVGRLVVLQGAVTKTGTPAAADVIATLPDGFRPADQLIFAVSTGSGSVFGRVDVQPDGDVLWQAGGTTETDYTSLSGICFVVG